MTKRSCFEAEDAWGVGLIQIEKGNGLDGDIEYGDGPERPPPGCILSDVSPSCIVQSLKAPMLQGAGHNLPIGPIAGPSTGASWYTASPLPLSSDFQQSASTPLPIYYKSASIQAVWGLRQGGVLPL
jgi:hypothetical protein